MPTTTEPDLDDVAATYASWLSDILEEPVSPDADFLDAGGNSMIAITLNTRMKEAFGVEIDLRTLFTRPMRDAIDTVFTTEFPARKG